MKAKKNNHVWIGGLKRKIEGADTFRWAKKVLKIKKVQKEIDNKRNDEWGNPDKESNDIGSDNKYK